ncbi:hypothetical protein CEXT_360611 [Caerostris extrusa]|uniref:Uncharacterized protein n=1 Tax=Caerostris extrusa TaxID=172846 RepID=A0AAV4XIA4_CAEEX|nr:hypothetical protein CEXT_360611 [Caerostris extrusa]
MSISFDDILINEVQKYPHLYDLSDANQKNKLMSSWSNLLSQDGKDVQQEFCERSLVETDVENDSFIDQAPPPRKKRKFELYDRALEKPSSRLCLKGAIPKGCFRTHREKYRYIYQPSPETETLDVKGNIDMPSVTGINRWENLEVRRYFPGGISELF